MKHLPCWLLFLLLLGTPATIQSQGTFKVTLTGSEIVGGQLSPVTGGGSLQLFGSTLQYDIFVPLTVLPADAHFHGPSIGIGMPQFSLARFELQPTGGIVYRGSHTFDPRYVPDIKDGKWYINLHSPNYDNGVLSGFILPVPEPRLLVPLSFGLAFAGIFRTSRKLLRS